MRPKSISPAIAAAADQFEIALKAARIPDPLCDGLWDIWVNSPARAHSFVTRFKDGAPALAHKQAPGTTAVELPADLVTALGGPAAVVQLVARAASGGGSLADDVMGQIGGKAGPGTLRSDEKPPSKPTKARPGGLAQMYDEAIKELNR